MRKLKRMEGLKKIKKVLNEANRFIARTEKRVFIFNFHSEGDSVKIFLAVDSKTDFRNKFESEVLFEKPVEAKEVIEELVNNLKPSTIGKSLFSNLFKTL